MKKTFAVRLSDEQLKNLKEIAITEDRSVSAIIRRMVDEGIKKRKIDLRGTSQTINVQSVDR